MNELIQKIRRLIQDSLKNDGYDVFIAQDSNIFYPSKLIIDSNSVRVFKNGSEITNFTYDSDLNRVVINDTVNNGDTIEIRYSYYRKYSDNDIKEFMNLAFDELRLRNYPKEFGIVNDELTCLTSGYTISNADKALIVMITALYIEPNNTSIRTPDFAVTPLDRRSLKEKIDDIYYRYIVSGNLGELGTIYDTLL